MASWLSVSLREILAPTIKLLEVFASPTVGWKQRNGFLAQEKCEAPNRQLASISGRRQEIP